MSWPTILALAWALALLMLGAVIVAGNLLAERAHRKRLRRQREFFEDHADRFARYGSHYGRMYIYHEDGQR